MKYKKPILYAAAVSSILYIFGKNASLNLNKLAKLEERYKEAESESNYAVMNNILLEEIETRVRYSEPLRRDLWGKVIGLYLQKDENGLNQRHEYSDLLEQANETFHRGPYYRMLRFLSNRSHMINPPKSQAGFNEILLLMNNKMKSMTQIDEGLQRVWHPSNAHHPDSTRYVPVVQWSQDPPTGIAVGSGFAGPAYRFDDSPILKTIFAKEPPPGSMYGALGKYYSKHELTTKFGYGVTG